MQVTFHVPTSFLYLLLMQIMGEDREYPILRLQPKMHFDIDI